MNKHDLNKLVRWAVDVTPMKFAEDAYGVTGTAYDRTDDYISGKYRQMHENFIMWLGGLDGKNRARLENHITFDEPDKTLQEDEKETKEYYKDIDNIVDDMLEIGLKNTGLKNND